ncbi:expressed hypothetical protein [Trichoplax adhaerens]|uniref:Repressor of RNA polymerase III transcription MAF1 n=1 Tax=Trichoplax adhaerens TaxID=10228 RepID=B3RJE2_TRIAD|nr:expressed hypothetical protein [Trichoplax adhaerens]EDV29076.1 expressed hypothetical protein [Trichoplax adhaerens]|eukprot:XP_002108278.1 expressed hypothetical protein [Trichoplax adhaerens]
MKLLPNVNFESLNSKLSSIENNECRIEGRVESYSCKMAGNDKKLYKMLNIDGETANDLQALSPSQQSFYTQSGSPVVAGQICNTCSRKTLYYLVSTLNASFFPDYDFSDAKSDEFSQEPSVQFVKKAIESNLMPADPQFYIGMQQHLWQTIDNEITLTDCDIYSYNPDMNSDPYAEEGILWSFNYFFYNKKLKRIIFFSCRAVSKIASSGNYDADISENMYIDDMEELPNSSSATVMSY